LSFGSAVSSASTAELDVELGSGWGAGRAWRVGVGDADESRLAVGWDRDWAGRVVGCTSVAEDGGEDSAWRS
jgi:hypothetical protein